MHHNRCDQITLLWMSPGDFGKVFYLIHLSMVFRSRFALKSRWQKSKPSWTYAAISRNGDETLDGAGFQNMVSFTCLTQNKIKIEGKTTKINSGVVKPPGAPTLVVCQNFEKNSVSKSEKKLSMSRKLGRKIFSILFTLRKLSHFKNGPNYAFHSVPQQKTVIGISLNFIF